MNAIFTRRSVRRFLDKEVESEKITKLLQAGMQAPSAKNQQPWEFVVVQNKEKLTELSKFSRYSSCLEGAAVGIVVLANKDRMTMPEYWQQDLGAVTQNIQLQAVELGLGSVWFGTAPSEEKMQTVRNICELGENLLPYSVLAVGYPLDENANRFIDRFDESRIKYI